MENYYLNVEWSKEFGNYIQKYKNVKKEYLSIENKKQKNKIEIIQNILNKNEIKDEEKLNERVLKNNIFKINKNIDFNIRRINYNIQNNQIKIINCIIMFLINEEYENIKGEENIEIKL